VSALGSRNAAVEASRAVDQSVHNRCIALRWYDADLARELLALCRASGSECNVSTTYWGESDGRPWAVMLVWRGGRRFCRLARRCDVTP
jgi:hypothetical protein